MTATKTKVQWYRTQNPSLVHVTSETRPGYYYTVDAKYGGCSCPGFRNYSHCKHNDVVQAAGFTLDDLAQLPMTPFGPKTQPTPEPPGDDLFARIGRSNDLHARAVI